MTLQDKVTKYYMAMASVYDQNTGYYDPDSEQLRESAKARYREQFKGRRVLEIACGSGYWTEVIGQVAASVLATDINLSMLVLAKERCSYLPNVMFFHADAYSLDGVTSDFDAAFANFWWSHMPKSLIPVFLATLHSKLKPGSIVLFVDQLLVDVGFCAKNTKALKFVDGNRLELRFTPGGKTYDVVKNFPTKQELQGYLSGVAQNVSYQEDTGIWSLIYQTSS